MMIDGAHRIHKWTQGQRMIYLELTPTRTIDPVLGSNCTAEVAMSVELIVRSTLEYPPVIKYEI